MALIDDHGAEGQRAASAPLVLPAVQPGVIRSVKLGSEVASYLRDLIFNGDLRPGSRLRLQDLASALGVSSTPIREALLVLDKEGLVESERHKGFRVRRITPQDVLDIYRAHAFASSILAERAASVVTPDDIARLRSIDEQIHHHGEAGDVEAVARLNHDFHRLIHAKAPDSELLRRFLRESTRYVPRRVYLQIEGWFNATEEEHGPIIAALEAHDGAVAGRLMGSHVVNAGDLLVEHLHKIGVW